MKRTQGLFIAMAMTAACTGCIPEKRIAWSPDGRTGAVCSEKGLYFIDRDGHVNPARLPDTASRVAWMSDSKRLVVVHVKKAHDWSGIEDLFTQEQKARVAAEAKEVRQRLLDYTGDLDKFDLDPGKRMSQGREAAVVTYMLSHESAGLAEKLGDKWESVSKIEADIWTLQLFELEGETLKPATVLVRSLEEIRQPKVSPTQSAVGFIMAEADGTDDGPGSLQIVPIVGGAARSVAQNVGLDFAWSPDGVSVALIRCHSKSAENDQSLQLGSLTTVKVAAADGALLPEWGQADDRVGLLFNPGSGVHWMVDGRIVFSSAEVTLPATRRDMPQQWSLFVWDPRMPAGVGRAMGRDFSGQLDPSMALFEVSPDERSVLLHGPKGQVMMYDFREGTTTMIQDAEQGEGKTRSLATWRGKDEVCFVGPLPGAPAKNAEAMIWKDGKTTTLSGSWPKEMREGWMTDK